MLTFIVSAITVFVKNIIPDLSTVIISGLVPVNYQNSKTKMKIILLPRAMKLDYSDSNVYFKQMCSSDIKILIVIFYTMFSSCYVNVSLPKIKYPILTGIN